MMKYEGRRDGIHGFFFWSLANDLGLRSSGSDGSYDADEALLTWDVECNQTWIEHDVPLIADCELVCIL